jgi:hypothetical protein
MCRCQFSPAKAAGPETAASLFVIIGRAPLENILNLTARRKKRGTTRPDGIARFAAAQNRSDIIVIV